VASVSLIASSSSTSSDSTVASFPVVIDVTGAPSGVYPGDSATTSIIVKEIANAIEVPTAAISYQTGQATVTKVVGGSHVSQAVTTGVSLNGETQITSGLGAGDTVVEQAAKLSTSGGTSKSLFGGTSTRRGTGTGGEFPAGGGFGGGTPPAGGFGGAGGGGAANG
jgi:membrane fusion protein, macrolide-specific efflux system